MDRTVRQSPETPRANAPVESTASPGKRARTDALSAPAGAPPRPAPTAAPGPTALAGPTVPGGMAEAFAGSTALPFRAEMEAAFDQDFSTVRAATGRSDEMARFGAEAATLGEAIAFAPAAPDRHLVAHELTHVVQNRGGSARHGTLNDPSSAAEREAEAVADRVARGAPAGAITEAPAAAVQRFTPQDHEAVSVQALADTYSAGESAAIYAANWERDYAQGPAEIANVVLAWRRLRSYARAHGGAVGPYALPFRDAMWALVDRNLRGLLLSTALGGHDTWEHMDQPAERADDPDSASARWQGRAGGLAGYIADTRAYIEEQMIAAVDVYRLVHGEQAAGRGLDPWHGVERPFGYVAPNVHRVSGVVGRPVTSDLPDGHDDADTMPRDVVRDGVRARARELGSRDPGPMSASETEVWDRVGQHMGRAMHAFEDFWSHSNWIELAQSLARLRAAGGEHRHVPPSMLMTGSFTLPSQAHALGHKLLMLVDAFRNDVDDVNLLRDAYGMPRRGPARPVSTEHLRADADTALDALVDVAWTGNDMEEAVQSGERSLGEFLGNEGFLEALARKGRELMAEGQAESPRDSHARIAKDVEGGPGHDLAMRLATEADRQVFGPLRAIMDQRDTASATASLTAQLALVDRILQPPSVDHPLWPLVEDGA